MALKREQYRMNLRIGERELAQMNLKAIMQGRTDECNKSRAILVWAMPCEEEVDCKSTDYGNMLPMTIGIKKQ